ncbi:hypothetical protein [Halobacteriovorax sp. CON-3]|uniref:hypothetical protein n=1 Tax=Halobacteriovorax sp. CON-3 TaxID=3157710 RepID=UPI003716891E
MAKEHDTNLFKKHIFICKSCKKNECPMLEDAMALKSELKSYFNEKYGKGVVRVTSSDCLGKCREGIHIVSYPEAKWFKDGTKESAQVLKDYVDSST